MKNVCSTCSVKLGSLHCMWCMQCHSSILLIKTQFIEYNEVRYVYLLNQNFSKMKQKHLYFCHFFIISCFYLWFEKPRQN
uniref:Uncharacterized protein n=1 Tax=Octopus bimaculoides TaxID=37653 RepID=A0A0L8HTY2_OCTBM